MRRQSDRSQVLERYERTATMLDKPLTDDSVEWLKEYERAQWKPRLRGIWKQGDPTATSQGFRSMPLVPGGPTPFIANQTTVAATTITRLWDAPTYTPIAANFCNGGELFKVTAWGIATSPASAQTAVFTPIWGTSATLAGNNPASLGASVAGSTIASKTSVPWNAEMWVHVRTAGLTGTATCGGSVRSEIFNGVAAGTAVGANVTFGGGNPTTIETTTAAGLLLAVTPNIATLTWICQGILPESLN
jgi:hypothetical protein